MKERNDRLALYRTVASTCSSETTRLYSTSFDRSIRSLGPQLRQPIYDIYGFVRLVDEVVDSFAGFDQRGLLDRLKKETYLAIEQRISTNPILHAFQETYHRFSIEKEHVDLFFRSMEMDLDKAEYDAGEYDAYITGSAEVVGLMCLKVFVRGDASAYNDLLPAAKRLGAAFQKVNFLRDVHEDFHELGRSYFPNVDLESMDAATKRRIEDEIEEDLRVAREGIALLPTDARFGVYLAYNFYRKLLGRIRKVSSSHILRQRVRVPDLQKSFVWVLTYARHRLNLV